MAESDTRRLSIPPGLDALLDEMACQILRHQPANILEFLANYLEEKLRKRDHLDDRNETALDGRSMIEKGLKKKYSKGELTASRRSSEIRPSGEHGSKDNGGRNGKPNSFTRRIDELSSVLADALDKGQKISNFHRSPEASDPDGKSGSGGSAGRDGDGSGSRPSISDGSSGQGGSTGKIDDDSRRGSTIMIGKDKVTYRGSLANVMLASGRLSEPGGRDGDGAGGQDRPGAGYGDAKPKSKPGSLSRRIDELSRVLEDTLEMGKKFGDSHRKGGSIDPDDQETGKGQGGEGPGDGTSGEGPGDGTSGEGPGDGTSGEGPSDGTGGEGQDQLSYGEQIEAAREAQAQLKAEAEAEWERAQEIKAREEAIKAARQSEYMNMLISQIEDMSQSVNLALAVLGPITTDPNSAPQNADRRGGHSGHNADGANRTPGGSSGARDGDPGVSQMHPTSANRNGDAQVGDTNSHPEPYLGHSVHPAGDLRNDATGQAIARMDGNMPDHWRDPDLTAAGRAVNRGMRASLGRHIDTMKQLIYGELAFAEAPIHAVVLGVSLGILAALAIRVIRVFWRAIY